GFQLQTKLADELDIKGKTIADFLQTKQADVEDYQNPLKLISSVSKYLKESPDQLFIKNEDRPAEIITSLPNTPCIIILGEDRFKIAVDQVVTNGHLQCPLVALSYMFGLFYVLNIKYPQEVAITLEFIQRNLPAINPERGSRGEKKGKKQHKVNPKLLRFLSELNDFENPWKI
ncbi:hypothetical protein SKAU_G00094430, partial [Synaphobranchus kaupii]